MEGGRNRISDIGTVTVCMVKSNVYSDNYSIHVSYIYYCATNTQQQPFLETRIIFSNLMQNPT